MTVSIISIIALLASIALSVRETRRRQSFVGTRAAAPISNAQDTEAASESVRKEERSDGARDVETSRAASSIGTPKLLPGMGWGIVFCLMQVVLIVLGALGLAPQDDLLSPIVANLAFTACAFASFGRDRVERVLSSIVRTAEEQQAAERTFRPDCETCDKYDDCAIRIPRPEDVTRMGRIGSAFRTGTHRLGQLLRRPAAVRTVILMLAGIFAMLALEIPSNHDLTWVYPLCFLLEWSLITAVILGLYYLFQRNGTAPAVIAFLCWGVGMAEYFVITFKSMPIQPADLSALSTAAAVSGGYSFAFTPFGLYAMALLAIALLLCSLTGTFRAPKPERTRRYRVINLLLAVAFLGGVAGHVTLIDYYHTLNITVYTWRPLESYYRQGFLPTFISSAQTIKPPRPDGYSVDAASDLLDATAESYNDNVLANDASYAEASAQFDEEKPAVIAIMNETFSDLSIYQNMHADYQGPQFFKSLTDCLSRGKLYVSAYGGGTCNTEFEFLTGNSMSYLGAGVYPYTIYDLQETENLAAQFKDLGYQTTAMHPNHATNWNRENVYAGFGFDQFLSIEDFQNADKLRGMVTDAATYDKILELLESSDDPQFIFDVTMQNHSGYDTGLLPASVQQNYLVDGVSDPEINEYLSLIEESDRALEEFIAKLRKLDRKVIVVFFGDHQPFFPDTYNDLWFTGEDQATHAERLWQTSYLIWANYDVAGNDQMSGEDDLSTNYLAAELMQLIGAPLTSYQKAQLSLREALPAINTTGYMDRTGTWYLSTATQEDATSPNALAAEQARKTLETIQYYKLFGDGKDVYTKQFQSAANETDPNLAPGTTQIK